MLRHLYIRNFVLIDELDLDFQDGFSAFIGETGAGKSIFIDAISMLRADRASTSFVAHGTEKAIIEGSFEIDPASHAGQVMLENGFLVEELTTFTREISSAGKSTCRVDHRIVTSSLMREILRDELDIHGQRDSQYLLNRNTHLRLLDRFVNEPGLLEEVRNRYSEFKSLQKDKDEILKAVSSGGDLEYLKFQLKEIEECDPKVHEEEELLEREKTYKTVRSSIERLDRLMHIFDDELSEPLYRVNKESASLEDTELFTSFKNTVNDSYYALNDAFDQLRHSFKEVDFSEEEINAVEERLYQIQKIKRKYGASIVDVLKKKEEIVASISKIEHRQEYLDEIDRKIQKAHEAYLMAANSLSKLRNEKCSELDDKVQKNLMDLILPNARFHTEIKKGKEKENGFDDVEFLIRMNQGDDLKPLCDTASGGELSRLMLGLKQIFSSLQGIRTVIFDEIDTGVSGPVATSIGRKMKEIAGDTQVFSVTHLAPVAACADAVYFVHKEDKNGRTHTTVTLLDESETARQLALISSSEITDASVAAAYELLRRNRG